jgi:general secretion pathway protein D
LLEDVLRESDQRVPVLGRIPLLGNLFRARKTEKIKTNLMIFIRPTILRDAATNAIETNQKYNMIRDMQQRNRGTDVQLMPGTERPILPPIDEVRENDPEAPRQEGNP